MFAVHITNWHTHTHARFVYESSGEEVAATVSFFNFVSVQFWWMIAMRAGIFPHAVVVVVFVVSLAIHLVQRWMLASIVRRIVIVGHLILLRRRASVCEPVSACHFMCNLCWCSGVDKCARQTINLLNIMWKCKLTSHSRYIWKSPFDADRRV